MIVNIELENDLLNKVTGLLGSIICRRDNGCGQCDGLQKEAKEAYESLINLKRVQSEVEE